MLLVACMLEIQASRGGNQLHGIIKCNIRSETSTAPAQSVAGVLAAKGGWMLWREVHRTGPVSSRRVGC
jgi:hypothetical protein